MQLPHYPQYESYRDSGVEWLGEVPQQWKTIRLKYVSQEQNQKVAASTVQDRYVGMENVESWSGRLVDTASEVEGLANMFAGQDILFGKLRPYLAKVHLAEISGICSSEFMVLRFGENVSKRFYFYTLISNAFIGLVNASTYGSKMPRANPGFVSNREIPVPPLEEQQTIARFLDDKTDKIDRAVKIKEGQIALLRERKQIIIQEAVTKGLNPDAPMKDSGIDWIGEIPAHWDVENPKWLFRHRKEKARKGEQQLAATQKYGVIPQQEYMELEGRRIVQVFLDFDILKHVEAGDFVMSMRSFQGGIEYSDYTGCVSSAYVAMEPGELIHAPYYKYLLKSPRFIEALQVTSNLVRDGQALRFDNFTMVTLPVVPLDEQRQIAAHIDDALAKSDRAIELKERQIEALKEYKATLINAAVTGKIKVI